MNFTGPKVKKSRALGVALTPKAQKYMRNRPYPPGQHGQARRRRRSDFGTQLLEKQRLRFQYSVTERYLQRLVKQASKMPGSTGENIFALLETRLDALVLRAGLAQSIYAARQFVNHGHIEVNGRKLSIASARLKPGDVLQVRERSRKMIVFNELKPSVGPAPYLETDSSGYGARLAYVPPRAEIPVICEEHLVVEYYSR
ncbi:MAG: 30S ribosomal protein S4 [Chloroflexota bacterium]|nr:30S ribosomal protein S4 [Chloroflexota bacterium]